MSSQVYARAQELTPASASSTSTDAAILLNPLLADRARLSSPALALKTNALEQSGSCHSDICDFDITSSSTSQALRQSRLVRAAALAPSQLLG